MSDKMAIRSIELPTVALIFLSYAIWLLLVLAGHTIPSAIWLFVFAINFTLFQSLTHEVVHGHPTRNLLLNRLMLLVPIGWIFPYERFRDTHILHHETDALTDPFDDPESWYYPNTSLESMNGFIRLLLTFNNTLLGRMLIGPIISILKFYTAELHQIMTNAHMRGYMMRVWGIHLVLCIGLLLFVLHYSSISLWLYLTGSYLGFSLLLIRTYLEHQAAEDHRERTVIIEKCCPLAFLFLFNNLHAVHHNKPGVPWYQLPRLYRTQRDEFMDLNNHYVYASYGEVFRKYFLTPKEKLVHPFLRNVPLQE